MFNEQKIDLKQAITVHALKKRNTRWEKEKNHKMKGLWWRTILHPLLIKMVKANRIMTRQTIHIIGDRRELSKKPVIYGFTHIGVDDVQILTEAIKDQVILFAGDPQVTYYTFGGFLFWLNGVIWCDTESKIDRKIAAEIAVQYLKQGKNLAIYPEGVWNITSNLPVLPLFPGIIKMAQEIKCSIVPVAVDCDGKDYYVNIGEEFLVTDRIDKETVEDIKQELRDKMASLKWEIWETMPRGLRAECGQYEIERKRFVTSFLEQWKDKKTGKNIYTEELVNRRTYKETFMRERVATTLIE